MYVCMYVCMCVCMYVCMYVIMYVCMYVCIYVCMYVCIYVCMECTYTKKSHCKMSGNINCMSNPKTVTVCVKTLTSLGRSFYRAPTNTARSSVYWTYI